MKYNVNNTAIVRRMLTGYGVSIKGNKGRYIEVDADTLAARTTNQIEGERVGGHSELRLLLGLPCCATCRYWDGTTCRQSREWHTDGQFHCIRFEPHDPKIQFAFGRIFVNGCKIGTYGETAAKFEIAGVRYRLKSSAWPILEANMRNEIRFVYARANRIRTSEGGLY